MTNTPKISVLMPVYNTPEQYLREAIESILEQTFKDFEFLILDDGSTNNAKEVIEEYAKKDERIRVLHHIINKNCPKSRNELLENARGEYVAYMDSDDISVRDRLQKQYDYLEKHKDVSILGSYLKIVGEDDFWKYPENIKFIDILRGCQVANNSVMIRLYDIKKFNLRYDENFISAEDYKLWSHAVKNLKIKTYKEVLVKYRKRPDSLSHGNQKITLENDEKVKKEMLEFLTDDKKLQEKIWKVVELKEKYSFLEKIFSIKNSRRNGKKVKSICILGVIIKFEKKY